MKDEVESFSALLRTALGDRIAADAASFLDMLAPDAVMEFPYAPDGLPKHIEGRDAIAEHLTTFGTRIALSGVGDLDVHPGADDGFVTLEFGADGKGIATGEPYEQRYVSLVWLREGRIVRYRDYWNPLAVLRALRGAEIVPALTAEWHGDA